MPVQPTYPGVYVREVPSGSRTITGVSTSVALFIGMAEQGPMEQAVRTLSYADFVRSFGPENNLGELHDQVRQFYLNGGQTAYVIRIANGAEPAAVQLKNEQGANVLVVEARSYGLIGTSIRLQVDYDTPEPEQTFNLRVEQTSVDGNGVTTVVASEVYKNLTMDPTSNRYAIDVLEQQSALVRASLPDPVVVTAGTAHSVWGVLESASGSVAALLAAVDAQSDDIGRFKISVDGSPFVTVEINKVGLDAVADVQLALDNALSSVGKTATVGQLEVTAGSRYLWRITSSTGGKIAFAPAQSSDISVAMQMGTANGGIDVGGWANCRPAPNGIFGNLTPVSEGALADRIEAFLDITALAISAFAVSDSQGGDSFDPNLPIAQATSLAGIRTLLTSLASGINVNFDHWTASVQGYRLVMLPKSGLNSAEKGAYVTATGTNLTTASYFWGAGSGNVRWYELGGFTTGRGSFQNGTSAGDDGDTPTPTDYTNAFTVAKRDIDLFNIVVLPRADGQGDSARADLWPIASVFAKDERAILLVDPPSIWATTSDVSDGIADLRIGVQTDHAAVYWPRLKITSNNASKIVDPAGTVAGIMARTDSARGVWKAPAGLEATALGVRGVQYGMSDAENGQINPQAVNAVRAFPNGIVVWGARTMVGFDNSGNDDYKYVPIRRFALYIQESLYRGLQWAVFEPNDEPLWRQIRQSAGAFMNNLFRLGAFAGTRARDAYFVTCGPETTTQNDINLGIVNVVIGFAPLKPAEFVVITLQQKAGEVQV